jgi:hypothetical protein
LHIPVRLIRPPPSFCCVHANAFRFHPPSFVFQVLPALSASPFHACRPAVLANLKGRRTRPTQVPNHLRASSLPAMGCVSSKQFSRTSGCEEDPTILAKETTCKTMKPVFHENKIRLLMACGDDGAHPATCSSSSCVLCSLCKRGGGPPRAVPEDQPFHIQRRPHSQGTRPLNCSFDSLSRLPVRADSQASGCIRSNNVTLCSCVCVPCSFAGGVPARSLQEQQQEEPFRRSGEFSIRSPLD